MTTWTLHWLEAAGDLGPWREAIAAEILATRDMIAERMAPPRLDILIQRMRNGGIPEIGMVGYAHRASLFSLVVDPENTAFAPSLGNGTLRRQVAHEVHHCLRMGGLGNGWSLGDALVSEGLAGHFVRWLFATPPELWEDAVPAEELRAHLPSAEDLAAESYDHPAWFFGTGGQKPRWLGYTLGYRMVGAWWDAPDPDTIVDVPAETVIAAWRKAGAPVG
ncbi:MAG: DUF2268 domain-containing putative Zn-dependent protease [Pseudomonadota bacterium]